MLRRWHLFVLFVVLLCAVGLVAPTTSEAAVTVTIVEPTNDVACVLEQQTTFRAKLMRNGVEDHTADSTFVWEFFDGAPEGEVTGNPVSAGSFEPGSFWVKVTGSFEGEQHILMKEFHAIGGQGEADEDGVFLMYHAPYTPHDYGASARPGQPSGVTYQWGIAEGADKVEIVGADDEAHVVLRPVHSSGQESDIQLTVAYSLAGTTFGYPGGQATVHKPTRPPSNRWVNAVDDDHHTQSVTGPPTWSYGGWMAFDCLSQFGRPVEGMMWNEEFREGPNNPPGRGLPEFQNDGEVPASGRLWDHWVIYSFGGPWPDPPPSIVGDWYQYVWLGGWQTEDQADQWEGPFWLCERIDWSTPDIQINPLDGDD